jgi:hypothetical protein
MDETQSTDRQRPDYLSEILSLCTTLSSEAIDAAEKKAKANQFDIDRGDITFTEVAINLTSAREILRDAIEKRKLIQLPITVQKEVLLNLQNISRALQGLMDNTDEIVNLGNAVEALNTSIWKYGLHNLSEQILGFQTKVNQLKQQEVRAKNLLAELQRGIDTCERLGVLAQQAEIATEQVSKLRLASEQDVSVASASRQQIQDELTKASTAAIAAAQAESQIAQYSSAIKTTASEIDPLTASIKSFFGEIATHRQQMADATDAASKFLTESTATINNEVQANRKAIADLVDQFNNGDLELIKQAAASQAKSEQTEHSALITATQQRLDELEARLKVRSEETIEKNDADTKKHIEELKVLKESIKEQLAQATGFGQFGAYQSRQNSISKRKYFWVGAVGILAGTVVLLTYYIATTAGQSDLHSAAFWIKLSMNLPLAFLITFCTIQYNRERRLEEEYAFKASVSISLTPYRDLIYSILERDGALKDGTYTRFVVDSVRSIFTSPTEKIFDSPKGIEGIPEKALKTAAELIGTAAKAAAK